jgi:methylated-DNA-[protein]-cysteine S-methyltransferase
VADDLAARYVRGVATDDGFALFDTALGACGIVWGPRGIRRLVLPERTRGATRRRIEESAREAKPPRAVRRVMRDVARQLEGGLASHRGAELDLDSATPFTRRVYEALRDVAPGETVSYGELAARAGSPKAARAVGRAMATNPLPLLVPCHRVIGANGKAVGFTAYGGIATKEKLLALEGVILGRRTLPFDARKASRHLRRADPQLAALMRRVGPVTWSLQPRKPTFDALARAIVYQQLTGRAAATIFERVCSLFPTRLRAEHVVEATDERLRSAGLSRAKTAALKDLAAKQVAGELPSREELDGMDDEAIVASLTRVRGVGRWSAEMLLIFQLGRPDVLPLGDYAVRKAFSMTFGLDDVAKPNEVAERGDRWRPYRTLASWYLWRSLD